MDIIFILKLIFGIFNELFLIHICILKKSLNWVAISASSTFFLAIVALISAFKDQILLHINRPILEVSIKTEPPDCHKTIDTEKDKNGNILWEAEQYYFRLRINNSGKTKADKVEVFADKLLKYTSEGELKDADFLPINLGWSYTGEKYCESIYSSLYSHCDLFHIIDPRKRDKYIEKNEHNSALSENRLVLVFNTIYKPYKKTHMQESGTYELDITIASANAEPIEKTLKIYCKDDWNPVEEEMLKKNVEIKVLNRPPNRSRLKEDK